MLVPTAIVSTFEMSSRTSKSDTLEFYRRHAPVALSELRRCGAGEEDVEQSRRSRSNESLRHYRRQICRRRKGSPG